MEPPICRRFDATRGKVGAQVFVGFLRGPASEPQELLPLPAGLPPVRLSDIRSDRFRRTPKLKFMQQAARTAIEKAISFRLLQAERAR